MKTILLLSLLLISNIASAQTYPTVGVTCASGLARPRSVVELKYGVYEGIISRILRIDEERSIVFTEQDLPNYGLYLGSRYTFKLVSQGKTLVSTSETYPVTAFLAGKRMNISFFFSDEATGIKLDCVASTQD